MFSGDMDADSGLLREETTTTNSVSGLLCCDTTRKCKNNPKSEVCRIICVMIALVCAFVGGVIFQKYANRTETEPPVSHHTSNYIGEAVEAVTEGVDDEMGSRGRISNSTGEADEAVIKGEEGPEFRLLPGNCSRNYCIQCTAMIPARKVLLNKTCEHDSRIRHESCSYDEVENICYTQQQLKELKESQNLTRGGNYAFQSPSKHCFWTGKHCYTLEQVNDRNNRVQVDSKCCTNVQMTDPPCYNGGYSVCVNESEPVCQCQNGWRGKICQEKFTVTVQCKCYKKGYKFCGEEHMDHCDNRRNNTTECHMYADRPDGKFHCICNMSNDSVNGKDYETEPCSSPQANTTPTESEPENLEH